MERKCQRKDPLVFILSIRSVATQAHWKYVPVATVLQNDIFSAFHLNFNSKCVVSDAKSVFDFVKEMNVNLATFYYMGCCMYHCIL